MGAGGGREGRALSRSRRGEAKLRDAPRPLGAARRAGDHPRMHSSTFRLVLAYGALAAVVAVCLRLVSLMPLRFDWGRELVAAAIALAGVGAGLWFARRPHEPAAVAPPIAPPAEPSPAPPPDDGANPLSPRERRVLDLLAEGRSNKEIARELGVSANTVKTHLANVYAKLGARRRTEAVAAARRSGMIVR
jgi:DNA-binding CsgD family transcriptional regulator